MSYDKETKQNSDQLKAVHSEALQIFDKIQSAVRDVRKECLQDRRFYSIAGAQWEGELGEQFKNKMRFEVNKVHLSVIRIFNEYRNNRITVEFLPKDGSKDNKLADACSGMFRADSQSTCAEEALDNAFEEAVGGGYGAFRVLAEYDDDDEYEEESERRQRVTFAPIFDADTCVYFDLDAKRQDKSDAKRCYVLTPLTPEAYFAEYGDNPMTWPKDVQQTEFDWSTPDVVFVAEYYVKEKVTQVVYTYKDISGMQETYTDEDFEADPTLKATLQAIGTKKVDTKKRSTTKIHKYILSGGGVLEDCGRIAGKNIPIVPVYGKRWFVDNVERMQGAVRLSKDTQRLKNVQLSKLGEQAAASSFEKPILTPEQVASHQLMWENDPVKNYPYMLLNPITGPDGMPLPAAPIGYTKPPEISPAAAALLTIVEQDMRDITGNQQGGEQMISNIADKTVERIQERLDMQTYIYMSNMAKAVKRGGEIWLGIAKEVIVEEGRKMKSIGLSDEVDTVELLRPVIEDGKTVYENDLSEADFEVTAHVGPTSASKRKATVHTLQEMMAQVSDPETTQVLSSMILMNMEGEGVQDVRDYFRNQLIRRGVIKPTEEEAQKLEEELANQPPDPNAKYLEAAAEEAQANSIKAKADTVLTVAKVDETRAKVLELLSGIDQAERANVLESARLALDTVAALNSTQQAPAAAQPTQEQPPLTNAQGWPLHKDADGNLAYVGPNGEIEEV